MSIILLGIYYVPTHVLYWYINYTLLFLFYFLSILVGILIKLIIIVKGIILFSMFYIIYAFIIVTNNFTIFRLITMYMSNKKIAFQISVRDPS